MRRRRDARDRALGSIAKVYYWTLTDQRSMRKLLDFGVDGLVVNRPAALKQVLTEEPYRSLYRLAAPGDSQFEVHGAGWSRRSKSPEGRLKPAVREPAVRKPAVQASHGMEVTVTMFDILSVPVEGSTQTTCAT